MSSEAKTLALSTTCLEYCLKSSVRASLKATALPAIKFSCGHHCTHGNTALASCFANFSFAIIIPPLGHLSVL